MTNDQQIPFPSLAFHELDRLNDKLRARSHRITLGAIDTAHGPLERHLRRVTAENDLMECVQPCELHLKGPR